MHAEHMPEPRGCPRCELVNPPEALVCDCGYRFDAINQDDGQQTGTRRIWWRGVALFAPLAFLVFGVLTGAIRDPLFGYVLQAIAKLSGR